MHKNTGQNIRMEKRNTPATRNKGSGSGSLICNGPIPDLVGQYKPLEDHQEDHHGPHKNRPLQHHRR